MKVLAYTKTAIALDDHNGIAYPGEQTLNRRRQSEKDGVMIDESMWAKVTGTWLLLNRMLEQWVLNIDYWI